MHAQLSRRYMDAVGGCRAQARHLRLLALEKGPDVPLQHQHAVSVIDAHRDMTGFHLAGSATSPMG